MVGGGGALRYSLSLCEAVDGGVLLGVVVVGCGHGFGLRRV